MTAITQRHEFVYLFDVTNGNPNGDPDAGNLPRLDPETNQGLVTDVCLKRKVRNFVQMEKNGATSFEIYMTERSILNPQHMKAWSATSIKPDKEGDYSRLPKEEAKSRQLTDWMCANFYDIRAFGAVMTTGVNAGQVRGPIQLAFAHSVEPVIPLEVSITRVAVTSEKDAERKDREMGRKHIIPYGLYRAHGFVSAKLAERTGFDDGDLELFWYALQSMLDHDRSAARGEMAARRLIVFRHRSALGNAPAHKLFDLVRVGRSHGDDAAPARAFADYAVEVGTAPDGVETLEMIQ